MTYVVPALAMANPRLDESLVYKTAEREKRKNSTLLSRALCMIVMPVILGMKSEETYGGPPLSR